MKLEFVSDGSVQPLIRIFDFDSFEAQRLRELFLELAERRTECVVITDIDELEAINECTVTLRVGAWDRGLRRLGGDETRFEWVLREDSWSRLADKTDPFCYSEMRARAEWLDQSGQVKLLLTVDGDVE